MLSFKLVIPSHEAMCFSLLFKSFHQQAWFFVGERHLFYREKGLETCGFGYEHHAWIIIQNHNRNLNVYLLFLHMCSISCMLIHIWTFSVPLDYILLVFLLWGKVLVRELFNKCLPTIFLVPVHSLTKWTYS